MGRPPVIAPEKKTRIVLAVLAGEVSVGEAARKEQVFEQSIHRWKADFVEAGKTALTAGRSGPSTREQQLEAEVADFPAGLAQLRQRLVGLQATASASESDTLKQYIGYVDAVAAVHSWASSAR